MKYSSLPLLAQRTSSGTGKWPKLCAVDRGFPLRELLDAVPSVQATVHHHLSSIHPKDEEEELVSCTHVQEEYAS